MRALLPLLLFATAAAVGAPGKDADNREAKKLFEKRCSACHDPGRVYHRTADRDEWREIVQRMRRMPQSGITRADAKIILDYLVSLRGGGDRRDALGGRAAYGEEWLSVLETALVKDGRVRLGGRDYTAERDGKSVTLRYRGKEYAVALPEGDEAPTTARTGGWRIGETRYEVHLVLYRIRGDAVRIGRALRRLP